jgi:hypothetical protein
MTQFLSMDARCINFIGAKIEQCAAKIPYVAEERSARAKKAAQARWATRRQQEESS